MMGDDLRQRADCLRSADLETVLTLRGAVRDRRDRRKWHTEQGPLSISGCRFMNWQSGQGGGGAIDLVMHLAAVDFHRAVAWLEQHLQVPVPAGDVSRHHRQTRAPTMSEPRTPLRLPAPDDRQWDRVLQYLTRRRRLADALLEPLKASGRLYADCRGNAVFVMVAGRKHRPVGAELRGTGDCSWRGMAFGSRKNAGYFWIGRRGATSVVLCESAIDAISCLQIDPENVCISTAGVRTNPAWLAGLIARGYRIHCGFDVDDAGEAAARQMIALHPAIHRLRPPAHDWNDALARR